MPVQRTYPGVYVEEIPSQTRTITGVATSVGGFLGTFEKGPLNEAVQVFTFGDFEREFGGLSRHHEASYAVRQFFLNGGSQAWIVRVAEQDLPANNASAASLTVNDTAAAAAALFVATSGRRVRTDSAINPGEAGNNLRIEIDYRTIDPATRFNMTVSEVVLRDDRTEVRVSEEFRNLTFDPNDSRYVLDHVNANSRLIQISFPGAIPAIGDQPAVTGILGEPIPSLPGSLNDFTDINLSLVLQDAAGVVTTTVAAVPLPIPPTSAVPTTNAELAAFLQRAIRALASDPALEAATGFDPNFRPYYAGATVEVVNGPVVGDRHLRILTGRGARPFVPGAQFLFTEPGGGTGDLGSYGLTTPQNGVQQFQLTGGQDGRLFNAVGDVLETSDTSFTGSPAAATGIHAFNDVNNVINFFMIPEAALLEVNAMRSVYSELVAYAEDRRAMAIIDVSPATDTLEEMQTWLDENALLRSANSCVYFPRPLIPDPENNNALRSIAASGAVAGQWAATDTARGVWKAPAGIETRLAGVPSLTVALTDAQHGTLNTLGANCLRTFPVYGNIVWGARTLEGANALASEWKYLPIRRFLLFLEESLYQGTQWVVFEPNDVPLWAQVRLNIETFLHGLFRQGAMQGSSAREAFYVECGLGKTMTQGNIDNGELIIEVGVAPLKPAEFVVLKFKQITKLTTN
jgi:Bacteriophage tail sheath protein